jgi:hypothetical protein
MWVDLHKGMGWDGISLRVIKIVACENFRPPVPSILLLYQGGQYLVFFEIVRVVLVFKSKDRMEFYN